MRTRKAFTFRAVQRVLSWTVTARPARNDEGNIYVDYCIKHGGRAVREEDLVQMRAVPGNNVPSAPAMTTAIRSAIQAVEEGIGEAALNMIWWTESVS